MNHQQPQPQQQQQQIQIRANNKDLKGVYSNVMQVTHSQEEFILDFLNITGPMGVLSTRVIISPGHLKRIVKALEDNVKKYEGRFGPIKAADAPTGDEIGFKKK